MEDAKVMFLIWSDGGIPSSSIVRNSKKWSLGISYIEVLVNNWNICFVLINQQLNRQLCIGW